MNPKNGNMTMQYPNCKKLQLFDKDITMKHHSAAQMPWDKNLFLQMRENMIAWYKPKQMSKVKNVESEKL